VGLKITVETNGSSVIRTSIQQLSVPNIQGAAARGLNAHIRLQERQAVRVVAAQTKVPAGRVGSISKPRLASPSADMEGAVVFTDQPIPLGEHTFRSWSRGAHGASAGDWSTKTYAGSFIIRKYGGAIYKRVGQKRQPVVRLWGPFLPNELRRPDMPAFPAAVRLADFDLERRVLREIVRAVGS